MSTFIFLPGHPRSRPWWFCPSRSGRTSRWGGRWRESCRDRDQLSSTFWNSFETTNLFSRQQIINYIDCMYIHQKLVPHNLSWPNLTFLYHFTKGFCYQPSMLMVIHFIIVWSCIPYTNKSCIYSLKCYTSLGVGALRIASP